MAIRNDEDEVVFREAVEGIMEIIRKSGEVKVIPYPVPKVDYVARIWRLEQESKIIYPLLTFEDEMMKIEPIRKCLSLMLERVFPEHLEMKIVESGKPVELDGDYTIRDEKAVKRIAEGLFKLLVPSGSVSRSEMKAIMDIAVEYRNRVNEWLHVLSPGESPKKKLGFSLR